MTSSTTQGSAHKVSYETDHKQGKSDILSQHSSLWRALMLAWRSDYRSLAMASGIARLAECHGSLAMASWVARLASDEGMFTQNPNFHRDLPQIRLKH